MPQWKKFLLMGAGFGIAFAIGAATILLGWLWYQDRSERPRSWDPKALIATFEKIDTDLGPPSENGVRPNQFVFYYTLENTTDLDYRLPPRDQLELSAKLASENSLTTDETISLDEQPVFLPARQRIRFTIHLRHPFTDDFGPEHTIEERRNRRKAIAAHVSAELSNLDGFVIFDPQSRYQINFPNGWKKPDAK